MPKELMSSSAAVAEATAELRRIVVVDDSPLQLKIMSAMLERRGYEVWQAESAEDALKLCEDIHPDAVLSDWMMPGMDGLEFCRRFREMPRESYGYFILLTSKSEKGEIARGLDAGADDFLTKPVNADELLARIKAGARILTMERRLSETLAQLLMMRSTGICGRPAPSRRRLFPSDHAPLVAVVSASCSNPAVMSGAIWSECSAPMTPALACIALMCRVMESPPQ